ncbi:hypothetical protein CLAIMM_03606 [Cladophialophora immunda]|nr:hypothetical protein CLAIMM_03606 [Cladophialophora immunda]
MVRHLEYPKKPQNTVKRYNNRGTYDLGIIHSIINTTSVLHVSFAPSPDEPFPAILPMIGLKDHALARESPNGLPICVAATKVDGLVLSLTPNSHSYNYRSAVLQGFAKPVETDDEKLYAMQLITNKVVDGRWENTRVPPDNVEMTSTTILRVKVETGSGKIRQGGPHDEAKDENRSDITERVWTGVVPVYEAFDTPIPSDTNKVKDLPSYLDSYVSETNNHNRESALNAVKEP